MKSPSEPHPFEQRLRREWPVEAWQSVSVLVAVSGGSDSVALLCALSRIHNREPTGEWTGSLIVAHFNHGWREDAMLDEQLVRDLCGELQLSCHVGSPISQEGPEHSPDQSEERARDERYAFLRQTAEKVGARYLVTAHNANDQAETILHRIVRGTGLRGLAGIPQFRRLGEAVTLCRPILWATREEVTSYLRDIEQVYREDESNKDWKYTRNRIRGELLPHLTQEYNTEVVQALRRLGQTAAEANQILDQQAAELLNRCLLPGLSSDNNEIVELDHALVTQQSPDSQRRLFIAIWRHMGWPERAMGFDNWARIVKSVEARATICLPGKIRLTISDKRIRFERT